VDPQQSAALLTRLVCCSGSPHWEGALTAEIVAEPAEGARGAGIGARAVLVAILAVQLVWAGALLVVFVSFIR
jgi:hypothetical protein